MIHIFDKHHDKTFKSAAENTAAERGFYNFEFCGMPMSLENGLSEIEGEVGDYIAKIVRDGRLHPEDVIEHEVLSSFLSVQAVRTRASFATIQDLSLRFEAYARSLGAEPADFTLDPKLGGKDNAAKAHFAKMICNAQRDFTPLFMDKDWHLLKTTRDKPFLIGDQPLTLFNDTDMSPRGSLGLKVKGIQMHFPLTPTLALGMTCRSIAQELRDGLHRLSALAAINSAAAQMFSSLPAAAKPILDAISTGLPMTAEASVVEHFNLLQISNAERFVFSSDGDFRLVREMIASNAELRHGNRLVEANGAF